MKLLKFILAILVFNFAITNRLYADCTGYQNPGSALTGYGFAYALTEQKAAAKAKEQALLVCSWNQDPDGYRYQFDAMYCENHCYFQSEGLNEICVGKYYEVDSSPCEATINFCGSFVPDSDFLLDLVIDLFVNGQITEDELHATAVDGKAIHYCRADARGASPVKICECNGIPINQSVISNNVFSSIAQANGANSVKQISIIENH